MSSDLDQQIRRHVTAVVEASPTAPDFASIAGRGGSGGPSRRRPRNVMLLTIAALVMVTAGAAALAGIAATRSPGGGHHTGKGAGHGLRRSRVVDVAATPKGWVPVDYGMAQISVPSNWNVYYEPLCFFGGQKPGWVQVGMVKTDLQAQCPLSKVDPRAPHAVIEPDDAPGLPTGTHMRRIVVNGITVYQYLGPAPGTTTPPPLYFHIPRLGLELVVGGADAMAVLHTLTWSPRAVVLSNASLSTPPKDWKAVTARLGNVSISFKVPPSWRESRSVYPYGECEWAAGWQLQNASGTVVISSDKNIVPLFCPEYLNGGTAVTASNWLRIDVNMTRGWLKDLGLVFPPATSKSCFDVHRIRLCPATSPNGSILFLRSRVTLVGGTTTITQPVMISLGLGGNGEIARKILDSVRVHAAFSSVG